MSTSMIGPDLLARTLSTCNVLDKKFGNRWQYHSRSDHHSRVACMGILLDLVSTSPLLASHFATGRVGFGINHEMRDFRTGRKKNLDLVVCTPGTPVNRELSPRDFRGLVQSSGVVLDAATSQKMSSLPGMLRVPVGEVRIALEAKACMTAHRKARPRLYDELSSSHDTVHGSSNHAIAAGFVMVNLAEQFVSPDLNKWSFKERPATISPHRQPHDALSVIEKIREIPRRGNANEAGFDALGCLVVRLRNDGTSPLELVSDPPAPLAGDVIHYDSMIRRTAALYESKFAQT